MFKRQTLVVMLLASSFLVLKSPASQLRGPLSAIASAWPDGGAPSGALMTRPFTGQRILDAYGSGWHPLSSGKIMVGSETLGRFRAGHHGTFHAQIRIPAEAHLGRHYTAMHSRKPLLFHTFWVLD